MLDISWGETFVLTGVAIGLIGRKDLPAASRFLGTQVGRVVGFLQGARARADKFTTNSELRALQNELRSGLRELDAVKGELAVAASSGGLIGRGLGSTVRAANRITASPTTASSPLSAATPSAPVHQIKPTIPSISGQDYLEAARASSDESSSAESLSLPSPVQLAPRTQSVAAVAEEEWEKQGIGFKSRAELGTGAWAISSSLGSATSTPGTGSNGGGGALGGSSILSDLIQQSLIYDQYDRAVQEQDAALRSKVNKIEAKSKQKQDSSATSS